MNRTAQHNLHALLTPEHAAFLDATFAANKARFGDDLFRMEDDPANPPAPADPADPATPPAPVTDLETPPAPAPAGDEVWADPEKARAEIERLTAAAAEADKKARLGTKENAANEARAALLADLNKILNPDAAADEPPSVDDLTKTLTDTQSSLRHAQSELAVTRAAVKAGADLDRLLDSRSFLNKIDALDSAADDYATQVEALIASALEADSSLRKVLVTGKSTNDGPGGTPPEPTGFLAELARIKKS